MPSGRPQLALRRRVEQRAIGHRVPQQIGQPTRDGVIALAARITRGDVKEEIRRLQHRLDDHSRALEELANRVGLLGEELRIPAELDVVERTPERLVTEAAHKLIAALHIACRRGSYRAPARSRPRRETHCVASRSAAAL